MWRRGAVPRGDASLGLLFPHLAGTFHYLFNCEHAGKAPPHPAALVDTCERIYARRVYPLARFVSFAEIDWVYCLHRAARHCDRVDRVRPMLRDFAAEYLAFLDALDPDTDPGLDDLHALFGATSALAELQNAIPGEIQTHPPPPPRPRPPPVPLDREARRCRETVPGVRFSILSGCSNNLTTQ